MPGKTSVGFTRLREDLSEEAAIKGRGAIAITVATAAVPPPDPPSSSNVEHSGALPSPPQAVSNSGTMCNYDMLMSEDKISAARIARIELTENERDVISLSVRKMNDLGAWADTYRLRGVQLFATQVLCAAAVPVLIALLGRFGDERVELGARMAAMLLSIIGTVSRAIEDAYDWRAQAAIRRRTLTRMRLLFDNFCVLSGELFDPELTGVTLSGNRSATKGRNRDVGSSGIFAPTASDRAYAAERSMERRSQSKDHSSALVMRSAQEQLAAALDELRNHHSGSNVRRYVVAFSSLEDSCSESIARLYDRHSISNTV